MRNNLLNPDDFVISRRRKKYKFAKFHNAPNCFELDEWREFFKRKNPQISTLEIGAGNGLFSVELAAKNPTKTYVALDVKADRLQKGAYAALERKIRNIIFVRARADQIEEVFSPKSIERIWLTFPDPFPKKRSAGRRLTHPYFLQKYAKLLTENGDFLLKHDDRDFFCWSLEQIVAEKWQIRELSFDLHDSNLRDDYKIPTAYEKRWLSEGKTTHFVRAQRASR